MSKNYSEELLDLLLTVVLTAFEKYQEEWLVRHGEIKLLDERDMITRFLKDSNESFIKEYIESGVFRREAIEEEKE